MSRIFLIALTAALAVCGVTIANAQTNPGFNPDLQWCNIQGSMAVRGPIKWQCLGVGTAGQALLSGGPGALPIWNTITGTGTVTSVNASGGTTGLTFSGGPITGAGTLTLGGQLDLASGGITPIGGANTVLTSNGTAASWGTVQNAMIAPGAVQNASIANSSITASKFSNVAAGSMFANVTGVTGPVSVTNISNYLDFYFAATQGDLLFRNVSGWSKLVPGLAGQFLATGGTGANPSWQTVQGGNLGSIPNNSVLANISGSSAPPTNPSVTQLLDSALGNTQGNIIYRNATDWTVLAPGTVGTLLQSNGAANPSWTTLGSIRGTQTNNNAAAGIVGETIESVILSGSGVSVAIGTPVNITSITLSAGDWDLSAQPYASHSASVIVNSFRFSLSTTSATENLVAPYWSGLAVPYTSNGGVNTLPISPIRISLATPTTYYLVAFTNSSGGGMTAYGSLRARRMR